MNDPVTRSRLWARHTLLLILIIGVALRLHGLESLPLAEDDLYTLRDALKPDPWRNSRPVYIVLQHTLLQFFPPTPLFLRLPAFVFGVLGVWLTWSMAKRAFGQTAGLVSSFLVAISPWHLYASQFARYWSLVYVIAVLMYLALLSAAEKDRPRYYLLTLATVIGGAFTHPTLVFPIPGVFVALALFSKEGHIRWNWPTRRAWIFLWGPLAVGMILISAPILMKLAQAGGALSGLASRDTAGILRLVPAMVQWAGPTTSVAAVISALYFLANHTRSRDRRWGALALFGCGSAVALMFVTGLGIPVYADYGMAMLPLIYVTIGAAIAKLGRKLAVGHHGWPIAATVMLAADVLPGTVSHLSDGTRFDYRPAYAYVQKAGGDFLVLGGPKAMQQYYAPTLRFQSLKMDVAQLERTFSREKGFWVIGSYRRYGMLHDSTRAIERWLDASCRVVLRTERPRLDYRMYRVQLHWCGDVAPPG